MSELSPRARLILDRYRASDSLSPHQKQLLLDTVLERVGRGELPRFDVDARHLDAGHGPRARVVGRAGRWWGAAAALLGASGVAAAAVLGAREMRRAEPADALQSARATPIATTHAPAFALDVSRPAADVPAPVAPPDAPRTAPRATAGARRSKGSAARNADVKATPAPDDTIDAEVRLVSAAQHALNAGNPSRALALLDEHAARFPDGKLTDTRSVARIVALCNAGQRRLALDEAGAFLRAYPNSPFAGRVKNVCSHDDPRDNASR